MPPLTRQNYFTGTDSERKLHYTGRYRTSLSDLRLASPRLNVKIDRDRALLSASPEAIANTLFDAYGELPCHLFITTETNQYDVLSRFS